MENEKIPWKPKEIDWSPLKEFIVERLASTNQRARSDGAVMRSALTAIHFLGEKEKESAKLKRKHTHSPGWGYYVINVLIPFNKYLKSVKYGHIKRNPKIEKEFRMSCIGMQAVIKERSLPELKAKWPSIAKINQERKNRTKKRPA
ncbi:MAG: hypothetical protein Q7K42_06100 [Candidatus Diapherotrites archaeon]|nr:hypothetical protein [Candidatus Diapherotrites archaeon]